MRLLLDTNAYSAFTRRHREVLSRVNEADRVLISPIVSAELQYGFRAGSRLEENMARFEAFLSNPRVEFVPITSTTADRFSRLAKVLRDKGRKIPSNDLWIAAQVVETGADLLSADVHFAEVDGLAWIPFSLNEEDTVRERVRRYYAEVP